MSDLSLPPLDFLPPEEPSTRAAAPAGPFAWPTPPLACYPAPASPGATEGCELEGLNGKAIAGRLLEFDPHARTLRLRVAARSVVTLRFDQFRRLNLLSALPPLPPHELPVADALALRPEVPFRVVYKGGEVVEGMTVGHHEFDFGVFVFEPADEDGSVRRSFFPADVTESIQIGARLGEALVEQQLATAAEIDAALDQQREMRSRKVGEILLLREIITPDELAEAIEQQARMPMVRIGEALIALGFITEAQLEEALRQQRSDRSVALGELLVRSGVITRDDLQTALARKMGYPLVDVTRFPCDARAVTRLPYAVATRMPALPLMMHGGRLVVALEDPSRRRLLDELEFAAQCKVVPVLARTGVLPQAIDRAYEKMGALEFTHHVGDEGGEGEHEDAGKLLASLELQGGMGIADDEIDAAIEQSDNSLVRLINTMILEAQQQGVSDIHIETQPGRDKVRIRFRRDGLLRPYLELPHTYRNALIARLKIMCDLDISEKRKPQDGKINFARFVPGQRLELRVATIPTHDGLEDAVLRLLASVRPLPLDRLNLSPDNLQRLQASIQRPYGMILCVGPTGSGKTTTLHSCLGHINTPDRKIWTAEDPIEITQAGLRQVQMNPKIDWTFAKALRAFLRADPDVVMVGEIRDEETAQVAIEASLTGHLVLSTLHTNSAAETVTRLLDMGMDPFNFADSLLAVLAQRLVRRLCSACRTSVEADADSLDELVNDWRHAAAGLAELPSATALLDGWRQQFGDAAGRITLYKPVGCPRCDGTGYRGRAGLHELMTISRPLKTLIQTGRRADELLATALAEGMRTLRQDGIEKVVGGLTTLDEVRAVTNL